MDPALANRRYRLGLRMFTDAARWLRYWVLAGLALAPAATALFAGAIEIGAWPVAASVLQWFIGAAAAVCLTNRLPVHLAAGVTRREFTVAFAIFGALTTAAAVLISMCGFALDNLVLGAVGGEAAPWGAIVGDAARYLLVTPVYFLAGAAIGAVAGRMGSRGVTVAILVVAAALYPAAMAVEFFQFGGGVSASAIAAWAGGALALIAGLAAVFALSLRSIPIRPKRG